MNSDTARVSGSGKRRKEKNSDSYIMLVERDSRRIE
jgi:hypothetical protein